MNTVCLVGRVGKDPEMVSTRSDKLIAKFSLAVTRPTKNKETDWFEVSAWEKTAEIAEQYVKKGSQIAVTGRIEQESWEDKDTGKKRSAHKIVATAITLLGKKDEEGTTDSPTGSASEEKPTKPKSKYPPPKTTAEDDEIPF